MVDRSFLMATISVIMAIGSSTRTFWSGFVKIAYYNPMVDIEVGMDCELSAGAKCLQFFSQPTRWLNASLCKAF